MVGIFLKRNIYRKFDLFYMYVSRENKLSMCRFYNISFYLDSTHLALKTVWILISWLLQKPTDLDLHCLQEKTADQDPYCLQELIYIWFHTVFERINCLSTVRYKLRTSDSLNEGLPIKKTKEKFQRK